MSKDEQYCYIKNVFLQYQIRPKFNIDEVFEDCPGKENLGKNPLGYIIMHLDPIQLDSLIPEYLRQIVGNDTFSTQDRVIIDIILSVTESINKLDTLFYYPYKADTSEMTEVLAFGLDKYSAWSFLKLNPYKLVPALFRHLYKYFNVNRLDEESGKSHLAHAECNVRMIELIIRDRMTKDES